MTGKYSGNFNPALPVDWKSYLHMRNNVSNVNNVGSVPHKTSRMHYDPAYCTPLCRGLSLSDSEPRKHSNNIPLHRFLNRSQNHSDLHRMPSTRSHFNAWVSSASSSKATKKSSSSTPISPSRCAPVVRGQQLQQQHAQPKYPGTYSPIRNRLSTRYSPVRCHLDTRFGPAPLPATPGARFSLALSQKRPDLRCKSSPQTDLLHGLGIAQSGSEQGDTADRLINVPWRDDCRQASTDAFANHEPSAAGANENRSTERAKTPRRHWPSWELVDKLRWEPEKTCLKRSATVGNTKSWRMSKPADMQPKPGGAGLQPDKKPFGSPRRNIVANVRISPWAENKACHDRQHSNSTHQQSSKLSEAHAAEVQKQVNEARKKFEQSTINEFNLRTPQPVKKSVSAPQRKKGMVPYQPKYVPHRQRDPHEGAIFYTSPWQNVSKNCDGAFKQRSNSNASLSRVPTSVDSPVGARTRQSVSNQQGINSRSLSSAAGASGEGRKSRVVAGVDGKKTRLVAQTLAASPPAVLAPALERTAPQQVSPVRPRRRLRRKCQSARHQSGITATPTSIMLCPSTPARRQTRRLRRITSPCVTWKADAMPILTGLSTRKTGRKRLRRKKSLGSPVCRRNAQPINPMTANIRIHKIKPKFPIAEATSRPTTSTDSLPAFKENNSSLVQDDGDTDTEKLPRKKEPPVSKHAHRRSQSKGSPRSKLGRREFPHVSPWKKLEEARKKLRDLLGAESQAELPAITAQAACDLGTNEYARSLSPGPFGRDSTDMENEGGLFAPQVDSRSWDEPPTPKPELWETQEIHREDEPLTVSLSRPQPTGLKDASSAGESRRLNATEGGVVDPPPRPLSTPHLEMFPMIKAHSARKHQPPSLWGRSAALRKTAFEDTPDTPVDWAKQPAVPTREAQSAQEAQSKRENIPTREATSAPEPCNAPHTPTYLTTKEELLIPEFVSSKGNISSQRRPSVRGTRSGLEILQREVSTEVRDRKPTSLHRPKSASHLQQSNVKRSLGELAQSKSQDETPQNGRQSSLRADVNRKALGRAGLDRAGENMKDKPLVKSKESNTKDQQEKAKESIAKNQQAKAKESNVKDLPAKARESNTKDHQAKARESNAGSRQTLALIPESVETPTSNSTTAATPVMRTKRKTRRKKKTTRILIPPQGAGMQGMGAGGGGGAAKANGNPHAKTYQQLGLAPLVRSPSSENTFLFAVDLDSARPENNQPPVRRKRWRKVKKTRSSKGFV